MWMPYGDNVLPWLCPFNDRGEVDHEHGTLSFIRRPPFAARAITQVHEECTDVSMVQCVCPHGYNGRGCDNPAAPAKGGLCHACAGLRVGADWGPVQCNCLCRGCSHSLRTEDTSPECVECDPDGKRDEAVDPTSPVYSPEVNEGNWWAVRPHSPPRNWRPHLGITFPRRSMIPSFRARRRSPYTGGVNPLPSRHDRW